MRRLISSSFSAKSRPKYFSSPAAGWTMFSALLSVVVLPAPLRPMKPMMRPRSSEKLTSFK